ncbi:hypothetical protein [Bailinhaonella thermotolerans]|uniref:Alkaline shock response membrane anchor protein AmaP n=1 Tax=Bailinhaonella thermotolerans TaxID=1070861 RepID=A0A3A4ARB5_9ACTN|nr:hypothetical protein [Bailinhaonella thermotolerans]RJL32388.1 hypothetical protein D5H75_12635 [Bailinhaonella thermotolerans]
MPLAPTTHDETPAAPPAEPGAPRFRKRERRPRGLGMRLGNRAGLVGVGLTLTGLGAYSLLRAAGRLGQAREAVFTPPGDERIWYGVAALGVATAVLGARWLARVVGPRARGSRTGAGTAMLGVALKGIEGVRWINVGIVRHGRRQRLGLTVSCDPQADLRELRIRLDREVVARVRRVCDDERLPALARVHITRR